MVARKFYKYRPFNESCVNFLAGDQLYYSSPRKFNDPMDSKVSINIDIDIKTLERVYNKLLIKNGINKSDHVHAINEARYFAEEDISVREAAEYAVRYVEIIKGKIIDAMESNLANYGIFCLSHRWDSPLMWSHYADEHKGICVELTRRDDVPLDAFHPVIYKKSNPINASDIAEWVDLDSISAFNRISSSVFYTKSPDWKYEKEWRDIDTKSGLKDRKFDITGVYFGCRCDESVRNLLITFFSADRNFDFYHVYVHPESRTLRRYEWDGNPRNIGPLPPPAVVEREILDMFDEII